MWKYINSYNIFKKTCKEIGKKKKSFTIKSWAIIFFLKSVKEIFFLKY